MGIHRSALDDAVRYLRRGISVTLVGPPQVGKSQVAGRVADTLESEGWLVLRARGSAPLRHTAYSTLRTALDLPASVTNPTVAADILAEAMASAPRALLLVDDLDITDDATRLVVQALIERRPGCTLLVRSTLPAGTPNAPLTVATGARIDIRPLRYAEMAQLVAAHLEGAPVDDALTAALLETSGGVAGLAVELVRAGRAEERIALIDEVWQLTASDLASPVIDGWAEALLARVSETEVRQLAVLAGGGPVTVADLSVEQLEVVATLEARGLITVVDGDEPLLLPFPPALGDYLRRRLPSTARLYLREVSAAAAPRADEVPPLDDDAAVPAQYFRDHAAAAVREARERWEDAPSLRHATAYLGALLDREDSNDEIVRLVDATDVSDTGEAAEAFEFVFVRELWERDLPARHTDRFADFLAAFPDWDDQVALLTRALDANAGLTDPAAVSDRHPETGLAAVANAYVQVIRGESDAALDALATMPTRALPTVQRFAGFVESIARSSRGQHREALATSRQHLRESRRMLDRSGVFLHSYTAALSLVALGRWDAAERQAGHALALGPGGPGYQAEYAALLRLDAVLNVCLGRTRLAEPLLTRADGLGIADTALPAGQAQVGEILRALGAGERDRANELLAEHVRQLLARGHRLAAVSSLLISMGVYASQSTIELLRSVGLHPKLAALMTAARSHPSEAPRAAARFDQASDIGVAIVALRALARELAQAGRADATGPARAADELESRAGWKTVPLERTTPADTETATLTAREREIALLAGQLSNGEIAQRLHLSRRTVENHVYRAIQKTGARDRAQLSSVVAGR